MQRCFTKKKEKRCRETAKCVTILNEDLKSKRTGRCPKGKSKCSADYQCYPLDKEAIEDFNPTPNKHTRNVGKKRLNRGLEDFKPTPNKHTRNRDNGLDFTKATSEQELTEWLTAYFTTLAPAKMNIIPILVKNGLTDQPFLDEKLKHLFDKGLAFAKKKFDDASFSVATSGQELTKWLTAYYTDENPEKIKNITSAVEKYFSKQFILDSQLKLKYLNKGLAFAKKKFDALNSANKATRTSPKAVAAPLPKKAPKTTTSPKAGVTPLPPKATSKQEFTKWLTTYYIIVFPEELHYVPQIVDKYFIDQAELNKKLLRKSATKYKGTTYGLDYAKKKSEQWTAAKINTEPTLTSGYAQSELELEKWIDTLLLNQCTPEHLKKILKIEKLVVRLPVHVASISFSHQMELDQILHAHNISLNKAKTDYGTQTRNNALQVDKANTRKQLRKDPYYLGV